MAANRWRKPNQYVCILGGGVALVALGIVVVGWVYFAREESGDRPDAIDRLDPKLLDPNNPWQVEAVKLADQLIDDLPNDVEALFVRGLILNKFVSRDEAAKCWRECIRRDPDFDQPYYWLGKELFTRGEYEEAVAHFRKAVELQTRMPDVRVQLADALINLGRPEEAVSVLQEQVRMAPKVVAGFFYLGQAYFLLGRLDTAADYYRQALDLNPDCHQAWHGLAMISQKRGEPEKAGEYLQKFEESQARFYSGHQKDRREFDDQDTLKRVLARAYTDAGHMYLARNDAVEAEACWARAAAIDSQNTESRVFLADLYGQQRRFEPMLPLLEQLERLDPENPRYCRDLGMLHVVLGRFDRAAEAFSRLIEVAPEHADGYTALSDLYVRTGHKLPDAVQLARKAVALQPDADHYFLLSQACAKNGDRPAALAAIARAIELDPGNPEYRRFEAEFQSPPAEN